MTEKLHALKLITKTGLHEFNDIIEYSRGKKYLFIRRTRETLSFDLTHIIQAFREYKDKWIEIEINKNF